MNYKSLFSKGTELLVVLVMGVLAVLSFITLMYGIGFSGVIPGLIVQDIAFLMSSVTLMVLYLLKLFLNKSFRKTMRVIWVVWCAAFIALIIYYLLHP